MDYTKVINDIESKYELKPGVLKKLIEVESGGNLNARSPAGAIGLTQLMPATAKELGVDPHDPIQNIEGGAKYLRKGLDKFNGNYAQAIAGYNAGHNNKAIESMNFDALPHETQKYTNKFLDFIVSPATPGVLAPAVPPKVNTDDKSPITPIGSSATACFKFLIEP